MAAARILGNSLCVVGSPPIILSRLICPWSANQRHKRAKLSTGISRPLRIFLLKQEGQRMLHCSVTRIRKAFLDRLILTPWLPPRTAAKADNVYPPYPAYQSCEETYQCILHCIVEDNGISGREMYYLLCIYVYIALASNPVSLPVRIDSGFRREYYSGKCNRRLKNLDKYRF